MSDIAQNPFDALVLGISDPALVNTARVTQKLQEQLGDIEATLQDNIARYLCRGQIILSLRSLVPDAGELIALANFFAGDPEYCPVTAGYEDALGKVLEILGVPLDPFANPPIGIRTTMQQVQQRCDDLEVLAMEAPEEVSNLRGLALDAWTYVEKAIKWTTAFYARFFSYDRNDEVGGVFARLLSVSTLVALLRAIASVEDVFQAEVREAIEHETERGTPLIDKCRAAFGRQSPFEGLNPLDFVDKVPMRNWYAHELAEDVASAGVEQAIASATAALDLARRLEGSSDTPRRSRVAPTIVVPIEQGVDVYGRQIIWFVPESGFQPGGYRRNHVKKMYRKGETDLSLHIPYFCTSPTYNGMFEPVMYPVAEVVALRRTP